MLDRFLQQEEGKRLEFKENTKSLARILQTIIAFANTAGGTLIIGVRDKTKEVVGIDDILQQEERIANAVADSITPLLIPSFQFHTWRNRDVLIISVAHCYGPYYLTTKGEEKSTYVRFGSTNRAADNATIMELKRLARHQTFDELPNLHAKQDDIDFELAKQLFAKVSKKFTIKTAQSLDLLIRHQTSYYPSNAALLLFGKHRERFFPDAIIRCGLFAGATKTEILDQKEINLPLPQALEETLIFISRHTSVKSKIEHVQRIDIPEYPPVVVREAILNTIVHADYSIKGTNIQVAIFADRIEITNPGALPFGLSLEKALSGISQLRNRVIGHVFRELGLIERWGSGLGRMIQVSKEQGIQAPTFEECDNYFRVTLYHEAATSAFRTPWQQQLVDYLIQHNKVTPKEASKLWQVTDRTASSRLAQMREQGIITEISMNPYDPKKHFVLSKTKNNTGSG